MADSRTCPQCGAQLAADAPDAPCSACLMKLGLESWENQNSVAATLDSPGSPAAGPGFVPPKPQELADLFPQYEILDLLGHGGMGAVYKARQKSLDRMVALKIIKPTMATDPGFAERFEREAKALARLNHPNIVSVYDLGESDGLYYFAMEYVEGANLRRLIETKALPAEEAIQVIPQICEALQFAHDEGIVHRDIKPENILVDSRGRVKIADFGLAKLLSDGGTEYYALTATHQVMGTPRYMAPEQMEGSRAVDHRADIYSLGVVFYEMLTGELPLGRFDPPSRKATVDAHWDEVVLRTLEKEPGKRYQNASDVKSEVERISDLGRPPVQPAATFTPKTSVQHSDQSTMPNYGLMMLGAVMTSLGAFLLLMSMGDGAQAILWVGMGLALGGGGCFAAAFQEDTRLPVGSTMNPGMLILGAIMSAVGVALLWFAFGQSGFGDRSALVWIGIGLTLGGGGCCAAAWIATEDKSASDQINVPPEKPLPIAGFQNEATEQPRITANLVIAWLTLVAAYGVVNSMSPHAANPIMSWILWSVWAVVTPTILCGVIVWAGQRRRGFRYPQYPGEWLWNINAIATWVFFVLQIPVFITQVLELNGMMAGGTVSATVLYAIFIATGLFHLLLALATACFVREGRWRFYLIVFALGMLARILAHAFLIASLWSETFPFARAAMIALGFCVLPVVPLVFVALADLVENKQYPWSHWVGVALQACFHATLLVYVVMHFVGIQ